MQTAVPGLADMELTFFIADHTVLSLRFVAKTTVLVTHQCFGYCSTMLAQHKGFLFSHSSPQSE